MTETFTSEPPEGSRAAASMGPTSNESGARLPPPLYIVGNGVSRQRKKKTIRVSSHVTIAVDADGFMEFDSEFAPEDADRMVDVLLVMLVRARRAAS